jgi:hypothetical protein
VTPVRHDDDGVPRSRVTLSVPPGGLRKEENWTGANDAKVEKLRSNSLKRQARARGLELRHSDSGYALIGADRRHVEQRTDLSLSEVESWLKRN